MNICDRKYFRWEFVVYTLFFSFYIWLAAQIPYSYDDWKWGSPAGIQDWLHAQSNSRYIGNFIEIIITRSELLKTIIMGTGSFLIPYLCMQIATKEMGIMGRGRKTVCYIFCNFLMLSLTKVAWRQTYGWVAGFANFVASGVFMLVCLQQILPFLHNERVTYRYPRLYATAMFFLGLCGQLLIENVAIFMLGLALTICVICYSRTKALPMQLTVFTAGTLLGLLIMFSSDFYLTLFTTGEALGGYRKIPVLPQNGLLQTMIYCAREMVILFRQIWHYHWLMAVMVLFLTNILVLHRKPHKFTWLRYWMVGINCVLTVHFIANKIFKPELPAMFELFLDAVFYVGIIGQICFVFFSDRTRIYKAVTLWISVVAVMMPLAITSTRGGRLLLAPHIILILFCGILMCEILQVKAPAWHRVIALFCAVSIVCAFAYYGRIYAKIGTHKRQWEKIIYDSIVTSAETVVLPRYPYEEYLWLPYPDLDTGWGCAAFKEFHGLASDVTLVIE